jgi:hypothetical protein
MFELTKLRTCMSILFAAMLVGSHYASAKCISLKITVEGDIAGVSNGLIVSVEVPSKTKGDSVTHVSQSYSIDGTHFRVIAWFNTTSNVIRKETCDRDPALVIVKLMKGDQVLDQQTLPIETAFRTTKDGGFELVRPVVLHGSITK